MPLEALEASGLDRPFTMIPPIEVVRRALHELTKTAGELGGDVTAMVGGGV